MSLGGERQKIRFRRHIPPYDLAVFGGGRERIEAESEEEES